MARSPQSAPRTYVECPRCDSPRAFVTYERVETQCSFCPECQYIWNTLRQLNTQPAGKTLTQPAVGRRASRQEPRHWRTSSRERPELRRSLRRL